MSLGHLADGVFLRGLRGLSTHIFIGYAVLHGLQPTPQAHKTHIPSSQCYGRTAISPRLTQLPLYLPLVCT